MAKINKSEDSLEKLFIANKIKWERKGFADYMVLDSDGCRIKGFIEVKPHPKSVLDYWQAVFATFCLEHGIPYTLWCPGEKLPDWVLNGDIILEHTNNANSILLYDTIARAHNIRFIPASKMKRSYGKLDNSDIRPTGKFYKKVRVHAQSGLKIKRRKRLYKRRLPIFSDKDEIIFQQMRQKNESNTSS